MTGWRVVIRRALLKCSIPTEILAHRGKHIGREYKVNPLDLMCVADVMVTNVEILSADMTLEWLIAFVGTDRPRYRVCPVLSAAGRRVGLAFRADAFACLGDEGRHGVTNPKR